MPLSSNFLLIILVALASIVGNTLFRTGLKRTGLESLNPKYLLDHAFTVMTQPSIIAGVVIFSLGALVWFRVLSAEPLGKSYPVFMGFTIFFLILSSTLILKEPISLTRAAGMGFVLLGTWLAFAKF